MAEPEVAGIGALLRPNKYSILKFVNIHPGGAAAASGQIHEDDRLVAVDGVVVKGMSAEEAGPVPPIACCLPGRAVGMPAAAGGPPAF
jgi:C-terminal processing protease CtpA/Prc